VEAVEERQGPEHAAGRDGGHEPAPIVPLQPVLPDAGTPRPESQEHGAEESSGEVQAARKHERPEVVKQDFTRGDARGERERTEQHFHSCACLAAAPLAPARDFGHPPSLEHRRSVASAAGTSYTRFASSSSAMVWATRSVGHDLDRSPCGDIDDVDDAGVPNGHVETREGMIQETRHPESR